VLNPTISCVRAIIRVENTIIRYDQVHTLRGKKLKFETKKEKDKTIEIMRFMLMLLVRLLMYNYKIE